MNVFDECVHGARILVPVALQESNFREFPSPADNRNPLDSFLDEQFAILAKKTVKLNDNFSIDIFFL